MVLLLLSLKIKRQLLQDGLALVVPTTERSTAAAAVAEKLFFCRHFEFLKIENYLHRHGVAPPFC
jgi:hypothetical protein